MDWLPPSAGREALAFLGALAMDTASPARLREIIRLAATPRPADTITVRFVTNTQPEPAITTLRMPEGRR